MKCIYRIDGNNPKLILDSTLFGADTVMFDLFASVPDECKDEARFLISESLPFYDFSENTVLVRVNDPASPFCKDDISLLTAKRPYAYVLPHATRTSITETSSLIDTAENGAGIPVGTIGLIPSISSVKEIENLEAVLASSNRIRAIMLDTEAIAAELNDRLIAARSRVASACAAAGVLSIDSLPSSMSAEESETYLMLSFELGFDAVLVFNSSRIDAVNTVFSQKRWK